MAINIVEAPMGRRQDHYGNRPDVQRRPVGICCTFPGRAYPSPRSLPAWVLPEPPAFTLAFCPTQP